MEKNINANIETSLETTHTIDLSDKLYKIMIGIIVITVIFLVGELMYQFTSLPQNMPQEMVVTGQGKAFVKPDIALISFGVTTEALKSQDAVNQNNTKMNAVIAAIKSLGVADKDIQTTLYNLTPQYDYPRILMPAGSVKSIDGMAPSPVYVNGGRVFSGYSLEQQISVKIRNFDNINSVLDKATSSGATNVGQLQFTVDNFEVVNAEARAKAIENAKEKIQGIAKQSGLKIVKLVNIAEGYNNYPQPMYAGVLAKDSVGSTAPEIQTGQQEVDSTVTLTYRIR